MWWCLQAATDVLMAFSFKRSDSNSRVSKQTTPAQQRDGSTSENAIS